MTAIRDLKPVNFLTPLGHVQVDESNEEPGLEILQHVHESSPLPQGDAVTAARYLRHEKHLTLAPGGGSLKRIPIRVIFDSPEHNIRARYEAWTTAWDRAPVCIGNGENAALTNIQTGAREQRVCKGPKNCPFVTQHGFDCRINVRMDVLIESQPFEVRSQGENTYLAILTALTNAAITKGPLSKQEFDLTIWQKSTRGSDYAPFTAMKLEHTKSVVDASETAQTSGYSELLGEMLASNWNHAVTVSEADKLEPTNVLPFSSRPNTIKQSSANAPDPLKNLLGKLSQEPSDA